ncbi:hypothetical protein [Streptococcus macacae]|uniref:Uncharacterized protein n=1 Tax=Streptococcus macacae NCTC 11558 TaxID=764298 RepID=G5JX47_9STRE|nr:hypothetical protein [Streptococcus macacae]EHJ53293.1 hypothetical protein STRMA_1915 [Streptococcus macacae NCTC 11558]
MVTWKHFFVNIFLNLISLQTNRFDELKMEFPYLFLLVYLISHSTIKNVS